MTVSGVILSGGKSLRMGKNKCLLELNGKTFIEHQNNKLKTVCTDVFISTSEKNKYNFKNIIIDDFNNIGAISGIFTSLKQIKTHSAIFISCDMPLISVEAIKKIIDNCNNVDAVVSVFDNKIYPVFALYTKKCLPAIENQIAEKNYKLRDFLNKINVKYIQFNSKFRDSFKNINTIEDYNKL